MKDFLKTLNRYLFKVKRKNTFHLWATLGDYLLLKIRYKKHTLTMCMLKFWKYFPVNVYFFSGHFPKLLTYILEKKLPWASSSTSRATAGRTTTRWRWTRRWCHCWINRSHGWIHKCPKGSYCKWPRTNIPIRCF